MDKQMNLPLGATEYDFQKCRNILLELTGTHDANESAFRLLHIVYAKGGDYSEKTLRAFAEGYLEKETNPDL